jgi:hypothetical protein
VPTDRDARSAPSVFTAPNVLFVKRAASATFDPGELERPPSHTTAILLLVALVGAVSVAYEVLFHPLTWRRL